MVKKISVLLFIILPIVAFSARSEKMPVAQNFLLDAQQAQQNKTPILILFSEHDCPYCELAKEVALIPISKLPQYKQKIIIREVLDEYNFYDFANKFTSADTFSAAYGVSFFPTVLIVDQYGRELAPRLIGIVGEEFYWYKVDEIINTAINNLQQI